jgi:hypothetical protein
VTKTLQSSDRRAIFKAYPIPRAITTHPVDRERWTVSAEWYGEMRTVFEGTLFECLAFAAEQE